MKCPHCGEEFSDDLQSDFCPSCGGRFDEEALFPADDSIDESLFPEESGAEEESLFPKESKSPEGGPGEGGSPGGSLFPEDEETPFFTAEPSEPEMEQDFYCPWEDRDRLGLFQAWWETTKAVVTRPSEFFKKMPPEGKVGDAVLYAVVWLLIAGVATGVWGMVQQAVFLLIPELTGEGPFTGPGGPGFGEAFGLGALGVAMPLVQGLVCVPVIGLIGLIINAGIVHLFLRMLQGASYPYEGTLRTQCYVQTTLWLLLLPCCGQYIAGIYGIVISIIGLNEVHRCGGGKAAAAVLLPIAVLCLLFCGLMVIIGAGMGAFMQGFE